MLTPLASPPMACIMNAASLIHSASSIALGHKAPYYSMTPHAIHYRIRYGMLWYSTGHYWCASTRECMTVVYYPRWNQKQKKERKSEERSFSAAPLFPRVSVRGAFGMSRCAFVVEVENGRGTRRARARGNESRRREEWTATDSPFQILTAARGNVVRNSLTFRWIRSFGSQN